MSKRKLVKDFEVFKDIFYIAEVASGPMFRKMIVLHLELQNYVFGTVKYFIQL